MIIPRASVRTAWSSLINPTEKWVVNFILTSKQQNKMGNGFIILQAVVVL
jgi:hypothetical protein